MAAGALRRRSPSTAAGATFRTHPYRHDPAAASYGLEAAEALGVAPGRVLKTLLVETDDGLAVAVAPVEPAARPQGGGRGARRQAGHDG